MIPGRCRGRMEGPHGECWDEEVFKAFTAVPWGERGQLLESSSEKSRRYITEAMIKKYGGTKGCSKCQSRNGLHTEHCRHRFAL